MHTLDSKFIKMADFVACFARLSSTSLTAGIKTRQVQKLYQEEKMCKHDAQDNLWTKEFSWSTVIRKKGH